ncbi:MBOAT family O-acyltransferase [Candidatus Zixiibacteriota bacterium]
MARSRTLLVRRGFLILSLCTNLGLLAFFKYSSFFATSFVGLVQALGWSIPAPSWSILLPVGISFYTFQTLSYSIDIYRGRLEPTPNFTDFALYVSFFPQLVAGPIVRASEFLPQLQEDRRATARALNWGVILFIVGLFKKAYLADAVFGPVADAAYVHSASLGALHAWVGTYAFAGQIYCDFSGYTDMAIAVALMLGFHLPDNFRAPYGATGFSDFWRRWHISLSSWLRDYLYISIGGNRKGSLRTQTNLAITMLLGGLWHGASWTFVVWGGLHGAFLMAERWIRRLASGWQKPLWWTRALLVLITFHLTCVAWVFFRSQSFTQAGTIVQAMFGLVSGTGIPPFGRFKMVLVLFWMVSILLLHGVWRDRSLEEWADRGGAVATGVVAAIMLFLVLTKGGYGADFIYFQF